MGRAYITFGSISGIVGGTMLWDRGVKPSTAEIICMPQVVVSATGTLTVGYLSPNVTIPFTNSVITRATLEGIGESTRMHLTISDSRYWWQFSHIDGEYNRPLGTSPETYEAEKSLIELMDLCLAALSATGDTSAVDDSPRPHVFWRGDRADLALEELCTHYGYVVVRTLAGGVVIAAVNSGSALPELSREKTLSFSGANGSPPQNVRIACADVAYQCKLILEAIGEDTDGTIKAINDLSYKPTAGWSVPDFPEYANVAGTYTKDGKTINKSDLAKKCVFKWYRVKNQAHTTGNFAPPGFTGTAADIDKLKYLYPLKAELNESDVDTEGKRQFRKAFVSGVFYLEDGLDANTADGTVYDKSFNLVGNDGIVKFSEYVFKIAKTGPAIAIAPADIALTCTCSVTLPDLNAKQYYAYTASAGGPRGVHTVQRAEIVPRVTPEYNGSSVVGTPDDNFDECDNWAIGFADAEIARYTPTDGVVVEYQGIAAIDLDGLRQQVEWRVGNKQPSSTRASLGTSINAFEPTFKEFLEKHEQRLRDKRNEHVYDKLFKANSHHGTPLSVHLQ